MIHAEAVIRVTPRDLAEVGYAFMIVWSGRWGQRSG